MGIDIYSDISEIPFLFFDTETTGLEPNKGARIIEMGAVKILNGNAIDEFNELVNPLCDIPDHITKITGIKNEDVKDCETFESVFLRFKEITKDCIFVSHNVNFDKKFLYYEMETYGYSLNFTWLDTWKLARIAWPGMHNYKLQTLAKEFGIDSGNAHRAKDDAIVCSRIFFLAIEEIKKRMSLKRLIAIEGSIKW